MHAGNALWQLYGVATHLRKKGAEQLAQYMESNLAMIGSFIGVAPPNVEQLMQLSSALENFGGPEDDDVGYASEKPQSSGTNNSYNNPEVVQAATTLVTQMVDSDQFGWAALVESVHDQLDKEKPFITPKQCRALKNIAEGKKYGEDEGTFWQWFTDEYPEAAKVVAGEADKA